MRTGASLIRSGLGVLAVTACVLSAAACAGGPGHRAATGAGPGGPARSMTGAAPVDAALVTANFGWVLTTDGLLVSRDGGADFTRLATPVAPQAVYFRDSDDGVLAGTDGRSVQVARTDDGGATWKTVTVSDPAVSPAGYESLAIAFGDDRHGAILARTATSQAFSVGTLFATGDGGATWSVHAAPEAGQVSVDAGGRTWLAGDALHVTDDQGRTWTTSTVATGDGGTATLSTPVAGTLPVTVTSGDQTTVDLLSTSDNGRTWAGSNRVAVRARTGPGVRLPVAISTSNGLLVFDTVAGHAYRARGDADLRPSGLPDGVVRATFADSSDTGWALAAYGTCASGKSDCVLHHDLVATANGGTSWRGLAAWLSPVG